MDFSAIFQIRTKKFWWMDVIFYFVISLLIATVLSWLIFLVKDGMINKQITDEKLALLTVGTDQQKSYEKEVINYRDKIKDFSNLLKNHEFASNVFAFMQMQTMPNVWFKQFSLDGKNNAVSLSGESDSMDAFSRQVAVFEKNEYVNNIGTLNSSLGGSARVEFNINLKLDPKISGYISSLSSVLETTASSGQPLIQQGEQSPAATPGAALSSEKLITSFHLLLNPEVVGVPDQAKYTFTLNVPYGTDVKSLKPSMVISPGATVSPASDVLQNFTSPVAYIVTAQDGSVQKYLVKVIINAKPGSAKKSSQSGSVVLIIFILAVIAIAVIAGILLFLRKRSKEQRI